MPPTVQSLDADLRAWAQTHGVAVKDEALGPETLGKFDGPTVTVNPVYDPETRCFVLAHSLGSVVVWALNFDRSRAVYAELRAAKKERDTDRQRFERALDDWSAFEEAASEYAVGLLRELGHDWAVRPYTEFYRADAEMMLAFHRAGRGPKWREFYPAWRQRLARGEVQARPYRPRAVPPTFRPVRLPDQQVFREEDGKPGD